MDNENVSTEAAGAVGETLDAGQPRDDRQEDRNDMFRSFVREFPQVKAQDIPKDVWDGVRAGQDLTTAYYRHLLKERDTELKNSRNRERAAGTMRTAGAAAGGIDPFDQGWEEG